MGLPKSGQGGESCIPSASQAATAEYASIAASIAAGDGTLIKEVVKGYGKSLTAVASLILSVMSIPSAPQK